MKERNGVRVGQRVRDLDGVSLGRVRRLWDWGFEVRRVFAARIVARYDEVRGERDGALVLTRSRRDLEVLAQGGIPPSWRVPVPPAFPSAATSAEAQLLLQDLARGAVATEPPEADTTGIEPWEGEPIEPDAARAERVTARSPAPPGAGGHAG